MSGRLKLLSPIMDKTGDGSGLRSKTEVGSEVISGIRNERQNRITKGMNSGKEQTGLKVEPNIESLVA